MLFDLDNTLCDRQGALAKWAADFCRAHGLGSGAEGHLVDALQERAYPATFERLRHELFLEAPATQLWDDYVTGIAARVPRRPDVIEGLEQMRAARWRLGILTNGAADIQRAKIAAAGLTRSVDAIVISEEIGARKPEADAFHVAVARCGGTPWEEGWMVGDNPENDIRGGQSAGLRTIWVSQDRPWLDHLSPPDHAVPDALSAINLLLSTTQTRTAR
ncbi:HAD family hydrolase [Streptomyces dysideae]|uniref:HAD family hydrolase n=1 Tax=Streptomyces dysideae TaxID=909626 RepID=UPI001F2D1691|nr:HAD family hydrolase [Streptomyces dysideae]